VADSGALRMRRRRQHLSGDHSLCRRCDGGGPRAALSAVAGASPCSDPAGELAALAGRLVAASVADPGNAMLARELRATLVALGAAGDDDYGFDVG